MKKTKSLYHGHRFPAVVISCAVRWFRFSLSLRDIEELLLERGVVVTYETIPCCCDKFGAGFAHCTKAAAQAGQHMASGRNVRDAARRAVFVVASGRRAWCRLDVLVQKRRDKAAAKRLFWSVLRSNPVPRKIVTDQLRSYPAAKADIPELAHVKHVFVRAAARVNNRAENSHQPTRRRERQMCGFCDARRTQAFLSCFGPILQHFALPRHQMSAAYHRAVLQERFATWHG
jgi:putative transposase